MKSPTRRMVALALAAVLLGVSHSWAQDPTFRPIFGSRTDESTLKQALDFTVDVAEAYDGNLLAESGAILPSVYQVNGFYTLFAPRLSFRSNGDRLQLGLSVGTNARYFSQARDLFFTSHDAGFDLRTTIGRHTTLRFNQSAKYSPSQLTTLYSDLAASGSGGSLTASGPGEGILPETSYAADVVRWYVYSTTADVTHQINPRAALVFNAGYHATNIGSPDPEYSDLRSFEAGGYFLYGLNRDVKLRLGYGHRQAEYSADLRPAEHSIDFGIDYSRPLSRTRRTSIGFSVGPRVLNDAYPGQRSGWYGTDADVWLNHQLGRTWSAQGGYHRGMVFVQGLERPTYADGVATGISGFFDRRTNLKVFAAYSKGELAFAALPSDFTTYTGYARLEVAATKEVAAFAEYFYYFYDFDRSILLPAGVPHGLTRNGVRVGVTLWVPVRHR